MNSKDITFIIVTYHSEKVIFDCLDLLPKESKKIIIENSNNIDLKNILENKYDNLSCSLMHENLGYGKANNIGIKLSVTEYVFILNPDVRFGNNDLNKFLNILNDKDFIIAAPTASEEINPAKSNNEVKEVDFVKGFAMLLKKNFFMNSFFDENIFLYLENDDFCKRLVDHNEEIYVVPKSKINHLGGKAVSQKFSEEVELSRNWHWIWSKFYFKRKHKGYFFALINGLPTFFSAVLKCVLYLLIFNPKKSKIYLHRAKGYLNAAIGRKSFFRPNIKI